MNAAQPPSTTDKLYQGFGSIGRLSGWFWLVIGCLFGLLLIASGIGWLRTDSTVESEKQEAQKQGWTQIAIGLVIILISYVYWRITRNETYAAIFGADVIF